MSTITYNLLSFLSQLLHLPITKGLILGISVPGCQVGHGPGCQVGHVPGCQVGHGRSVGHGGIMVFRETFPPGPPDLGFGVTFPPVPLATQLWMYRIPTKSKMSSGI